jgi:hypothetical protein
LRAATAHVDQRGGMMADLAYVAMSVALYGLLALVARGVERL